MNSKTALATIAVALISVLGATIILSEDTDAIAGTALFSVDAGQAVEWSEAQNQITNGSNIEVVSSGTLNGRISIGSSDVVLTGITMDLNGYTIDIVSTSNSAIYIGAGSEMSIINSSTSNGLISTSSSVMIISNFGTLEIDGVDLTESSAGHDDRSIQNVGTMIVRNSDITIDNASASSSFNGIVNFSHLEMYECLVDSPVCAIYTRYLDGYGNASFTSVNTDILTTDYGVCIFGKGIEDGAVDYSSGVVTMTGGSVTVTDSGQAFATNASGGQYAGVTITLNGVHVSALNGGCGMYLPCIGEYNLNGAVIEASQGIRIASGTLNIYGGTVIQCSDESDIESGIISGGSGGAPAAIVAGKGGSGYVGDLIINIGDSTIQNTVGGDAIIITDVTMGESDKGEDVITVNLNSGVIIGDVRNVTSNLYNMVEQDDGTYEPVLNTTINSSSKESDNVSFSLNGGTIIGDFYQDSGCGADLAGTTIEGNVVEAESDDDNNSVQFNGSTVSGEYTAGGVSVEPAGVITLVIDSMRGSYNCYSDFFIIPEFAEDQDGFRFLGWSMVSGATTPMYTGGERIDVTGDITLYGVILYGESDEPSNPYPNPGWDDDDEYVPPSYVIVDSSSDGDDTVTVVACAAAAVVAALMAAFLVIERRK